MNGGIILLPAQKTHMTKASELEEAIARAAKPPACLPQRLPNWMEGLSIQPGDTIVGAERVGNKSPENKTDILIKLTNSPPLKISAKLSNADYFGNWYSHTRIIAEFGEETFHKLTEKVTKWANSWACHRNASLFVGVSISFGRRTGDTSIPFLDIFDSSSELLKVITGAGSGDEVANCLYVSDTLPGSIEDIIEQLCPINQAFIEEKGNEIKVICRPVNPKTERSNRGKNTYTMFKPYQALPAPMIVEDICCLMKLGKFVKLETADRMNHNTVINILEEKYNLVIPKKLRI